MDCLFCKIIAGEIPSKKVYEDDRIFCFYDIAPAAPVHFLVIPKEHITGASAITADNADLVGYIYAKIAEITKEMGISSYRVVTNCGADAGQTVFHLHFHVLAGGTLGAMA
ncbi:MAG: histidine triad nucleotide-binding protein [Clostridia bacterium]|nr:histidine triad nucleotide-binding protein [Clostridia bacterium]